MGTSSPYGGPSGTSPLLPSWAQEPAVANPAITFPAPSPDNDSPQAESSVTSNDNQPIVPMTTWRGAKSSLTRFAKGGGGERRTRNAARNYVKARGGSRASSRAAIAGRRATTRLGGFLASVSTHGIEAAVKELGLASVVGKNVDVVFALIANVLAPSGATLEEAAARKAVDEALWLLYTQFSLDDGDINKLDALDAAGVREAIETSVAGYIYHRWLQELGKRIVDNTFSAHEAVRLEDQVKKYVQETVKLDFRGMDVLTINWREMHTQQIVERIYMDAYSLLEV